MADLSAADLTDVKDFFRIYYAPNNAILTLVGDFDPAEATEKIKKYFGSIPRQPAPPAALTCEEDRYGERRETVMDPLARVPMVLVAYQIPAGNTPDNYALRALADILGTGHSSRLYEELVKNKQLATERPGASGRATRPEPDVLLSDVATRSEARRRGESALRRTGFRREEWQSRPAN